MQSVPDLNGFVMGYLMSCKDYDNGIERADFARGLALKVKIRPWKQNNAANWTACCNSPPDVSLLLNEGGSSYTGL